MIAQGTKVFRFMLIDGKVAFNEGVVMTERGRGNWYRVQWLEGHESKHQNIGPHLTSLRSVAERAMKWLTDQLVVVQREMDILKNQSNRGVSVDALWAEKQKLRKAIFELPLDYLAYCSRDLNDETDQH